MTDMEQEISREFFLEMNDAELICQFRQGETSVMDYLMDKYKYLVRKKANALFLLGGDADDLIQEGMIGLFKAVRDYDEKAGSFYSFAELCISRQLYTAIEAAARKKHGPLNSYVSLSREGEGREEMAYGESITVSTQDPEQMVIDRENLEDFLLQIHSHLSPLEQRVLELYLDGMNYRQIALELRKPEKSIDNALQRIKNKSQRILHEKRGCL